MDVHEKRSTIAWFTLADCVLRRDRKKAFRGLQLLTYSIKDPALLLQVEGDLLIAFKETEKAIICYDRARELYMLQSKIVPAQKLSATLALLKKVLFIKIVPPENSVAT